MSKKITLSEMTPIMLEVLRADGEVTFTVTGNSMFPMLRHRKDRVVIQNVQGRLHKYDIPLYQRKDGKYILHRIIKVEKICYSLCGDNQTFIEHGITDDQIIGVVRGFYRDDMYIPCDDKEYLRYAKRRCKSRFFRHLKLIMSRIWRRVGTSHYEDR